MAGYIGTKAVNLSTTGADINGNANVDGTLDVTGAFTSLGIDDNATSTAVTIDSSGNVGIGVTTVDSQLHIEKSDTTAYNGSATDGQLSAGATAFVQQTGGSNNAISQLVFQPRDGFGYNRIVNSGGSTPYMALTTNNAERMRIDASGNVLVGTDTITQTNVGGATFAVSSLGRSILKLGSTSTSASVELVQFLNPNGRVGHIDTNSSSTSYVTTSDYRLKENVTPIQGAGDIVKAMQPVQVRWLLARWFPCSRTTRATPPCGGWREGCNEGRGVRSHSSSP